MICSCQHIEEKRININQYDPTRTTSLRNVFARDMQRRFRELKTVIVKTIEEDDCFGLKTNKIARYQLTSSGKLAFSFPRSADKVTAFMSWVKEQQGKGLLTVRHIPQLGKAAEQPWTNMYIEDSYKRGVIRARYEMNKAGLKIPSMEATGGIMASMSTPFHLDRVGLLYSRVFNDLKGITNAMDTQISRVLSQGIADGDNPRLLARKLVATIDGTGLGELGIKDSLGRYIPATRRAEMLARTEVVRAHSEATLQEYKNWQVEGVFVQAEFMTAGDDRVCAICESLIGKTYTIEEASGIIPVHPLCRCAWIPVKIKK